jgi:hypothetical protein
MQSQVISRQRVVDHGEVLTAQREVLAMLDLVVNETERIESRFLEPACGNGNFLAEVLRRKLKVVEKRYIKSQLEYERYAVLAVCSIYGIDILEDNVQECRKRLLDLFASFYESLFGAQIKPRCLAAVRYVLERNIIWGDAVTLKSVGEQPDYIGRAVRQTDRDRAVRGARPAPHLRQALPEEWRRPGTDQVSPGT